MKKMKNRKKKIELLQWSVSLSSQATETRRDDPIDRFCISLDPLSLFDVNSIFICFIYLKSFPIPYASYISFFHLLFLFFKMKINRGSLRWLYIFNKCVLQIYTQLTRCGRWRYLIHIWGWIVWSKAVVYDWCISSLRNSFVKYRAIGTLYKIVLNNSDRFVCDSRIFNRLLSLFCYNLLIS